jgi:hypothetical protein
MRLKADGADLSLIDPASTTRSDGYGQEAVTGRSGPT